MVCLLLEGGISSHTVCVKTRVIIICQYWHYYSMPIIYYSVSVNSYYIIIILLDKFQHLSSKEALTNFVIYLLLYFISIFTAHVKRSFNVIAGPGGDQLGDILEPKTVDR